MKKNTILTAIMLILIAAILIMTTSIASQNLPAIEWERAPSLPEGTIVGCQDTAEIECGVLCGAAYIDADVSALGCFPYQFPITPTLPTATPTMIPPTPTDTPSSTDTPVPPTSTPTDVPPTETPTSTPIIPTSTPVTPTSTPLPPPEGGFIIDRESVALFNDIPSEYLAAASNLNMMFSDRSVGANINDGLDCLASESWATSRAFCRIDYYDDNWNFRPFNQTDLDAGTVPDRIYYDADPTVYDRSNWIFELRAGVWNALTENFIEVLAPQYINFASVLSYQFSYLNVDHGGDILSPENGFFIDSPNRYDVHDLEAYIAQHPDKVFIFWTTSLARGIGSQVSTDFNNQMRQYAIENGKILFDVANIEAYTDLGEPCFDNRDGVQYCRGSGVCENYPDDGLDLLAICRDYTTELEGGHLGTVSGGMIKIAKAFWVLMARIAGWDGLP